MKQDIHLLETPDPVFSRAANRFRRVFRMEIEGLSRFYWETDCVIIYVRSGKGTAFVNGMEYQLQAGDLGVLHSYHVFAFRAEPGSRMELELVLYPYPEMVLMTFEGFESSEQFSTALFSTPDAVALTEIRETFQAMEDAFSMPECSQLVCNCLLSQLIRLHNIGRMKEPASVPSGAKYLFYIAAASFTDLSAESFCANFQISSQELHRALRKVCGADFRTVLNHSRASNANSMILRENLSMQTLAIESGFQNESSFYRCFRDYFGLTPYEYKEELRKLLNISGSGTDEVLLEIEAYILNHFREDISIGSCADSLYLSKETINRALRQKYGVKSSFTAFLNTVRLRYAVGLLSMSNIPIIDVALDSGFNSVHTFIRNFKKSYGTTPSAFCARYRRAENEQ